MQIKDILHKKLITINAEESISIAIALLKENSINHLPVVDHDLNLVGMVSKSDIYKKALLLSQHTSGKAYTSKVLGSTCIKEIMTEKPVPLHADDTLSYAVEILLQADFHALPVIDRDKLVGIVTSKDILEHIIDHNSLSKL